MFSRNRVPSFKAESVAGTAETTGLTTLFCTEMDCGIDTKTTRIASPNSFGTVQQVKGSKKATCSITVPVIGSGVVDTAPTWADLLTFCRMVKTDPNFAPTSTRSAMKTATLWCNTDGFQQIISGAMGNAVISGNVGEPLFAKFDFTGVDGGTADVTLPVVGYPSLKPPVLMGVTCTLDGKSMAGFSNFELDLGNVVNLQDDGINAAGYSYATITDAQAKLKINPAAVSKATWDLAGKIVAGTELAFSLTVGSGTNKIVLAMPKVVVQQAPKADHNGIYIVSIEGDGNVTSGNDEVTIGF